MEKTYSLRTAVVAKLAEVMPEGSKIYYQQAQNDHPKIYAVYTLDMIDLADGRSSYEVEINVVDYGADTATIEDLADNIQTAFNALVVFNEDVGVYFYADRRNSVEEEDRNILRRRLTFSAYLYER